ncbi:MAG TPA: hypothetical protein PLG15_05360 [Candidatus Gastranaerophilaceae bacterium]|nr:hypothetical protein [Candidatus Gastranaerophilaceae bacterium]HPT41793.1 hypothetical protein [Candidatus Gastranaerophilaceae bacterium]
MDIRPVSLNFGNSKITFQKALPAFKLNNLDLLDITKKVQEYKVVNQNNEVIIHELNSAGKRILKCLYKRITDTLSPDYGKLWLREKTAYSHIDGKISRKILYNKYGEVVEAQAYNGNARPYTYHLNPDFV